jgi:hypothetical protein
MTRGNQREADRAKRQVKEASKNNVTRDGTPSSRNENDKTALQAKVALKKAQKAAEAEAGADPTATKAPVVKKKAPKKDANFDDLLSAGLTKAKK